MTLIDLCDMNWNCVVKEGREERGVCSFFGNSGVSEGDCSYLARVEVWNIQCVWENGKIHVVHVYGAVVYGTMTLFSLSSSSSECWARITWSTSCSWRGLHFRTTSRNSSTSSTFSTQTVSSESQWPSSFTCVVKDPLVSFPDHLTVLKRGLGMRLRNHMFYVVETDVWVNAPSLFQFSGAISGGIWGHFKRRASKRVFQERGQEYVHFS